MPSARVLSVASQKGGVGKTTLALNLSYSLGQRGFKTLLVDTDPQGSVGLSVRGDLRQKPGLAQVFSGATPLKDAVVPTRLPEYSLLPVGPLVALEASRFIAELEDGRKLAEFFASLRPLYDVVVVDTPPGTAGVALGVLRTTDFLLLPLQAEPLAGRSVNQILELIAALREEGRSLRLAGLVLTMLQTRHDDSLAVAQESWRLFPEEHVLEASVPRDDVFLEASAEGVPIALLRRRPPAVASIFDQIAAEIEDRIGLELDDERERAIPLLD